MNNETLMLENILKIVKRELEFAERKNAYIFSIFSLMVVFIPFINNMTNINFLIKISICMLFLLYIFIIIFTILSIFPRLDSKKIVENIQDKKTSINDILIFFGHISKYSIDEYKEILIKKYKLNQIEDSYNNDIIFQINANSKITNSKFNYFKKSAIFSCIAIIQFIICLTISIFVF